jgi:hypothetical protein
LIIFGWGKEAKKVAFVGIAKCENCRNYGPFHLYEIAKKVTLYFVPVAKFSRKYYSVCSICEAGFEVGESGRLEIMRRSLLYESEVSVISLWRDLIYIDKEERDQGIDPALKFTPTELERMKAKMVSGFCKAELDNVFDCYGQYLKDADRPT